MAEFRKNCDVLQGYHFKKGVQTPVGYITKLKIADVELEADQAVRDPMSPDDALKVVGILSSAMWGLGRSDPIYLGAQISLASKQRCAELLCRSLTNIQVRFQFFVYEYDALAKKYFKCLHCSDTDMKGLLEKNGDELSVSIAEEASTEMHSPAAYSFWVGIGPQPLAQSLTVAAGDKSQVVKSWGAAVPG